MFEASLGYCSHAAPRIAGAAAGLLHGLSFAVKDVLAVRGVRACYGNPTWLETHDAAPEHARVVDQLLDAGASLLGLTLTDELALSLTGANAHYGTPENPAAPERVPGGSSCGSAVVVARGDVDFALGTDTGGSVRVPASHCGVLGLRPSHGAISSQGVLPLAPGLDTVGVLARNPAVLQRVGAVLLPSQPAEPPRHLALAIELEDLVSPGAWRAFEEAAAHLAAELGLAVERRALRTLPPFNELLQSYLTLQNLEAASWHRAWLSRTQPRFGSLIARRVGWMLATDEGARPEAERCARALRSAFVGPFEQGVWWLWPSAPGAAPLRSLSDDEMDAYTGRALTLSAPASVLGLPQLSLPLARVEGAPLGVSLLGPPGADRALLGAAVRAASLLQPPPGDCS